MSNPVKVPHVSAELIFLKIVLYVGMVGGYVMAGKDHFEGIIAMAICAGTLALIAAFKEREIRDRQG